MPGRSTAGAESVLAGIRVRWHVLVPGKLGVWVPVCPDDLLEAISPAEARTAEGRHIPYFGTLWPAGEALARHLIGEPPPPGRVLDLGCGVGVVGLTALVRGAAVTFFDWEPRSLELVAASAAMLGVRPAGLVEGDWRRPPPGLGSFETVLAADVLYEERHVAAVAAFLTEHLAPDGEALIADPRRVPAELFPAAVEDAGLSLRLTETLAYRPRGIRIDLHRVARDRRAK
jgi:predicted nicotinamide N-methyase